MITKEIPTAVRTSFGKGPMRRMRAEGKTPGVVYGGGADAVALEFETKLLYAELLDIQGRNAIITLKVDDGTQRNVVVKEIQTDPVRDSLLHADFQEIDLNQSKQFTVPVIITGKSKGVERGGILSTDILEVDVKGLPLTIPDTFSIDISQLDMGEQIVVGDLNLPDGVELLSGADSVCVRVAAP